MSSVGVKDNDNLRTARLGEPRLQVSGRPRLEPTRPHRSLWEEPVLWEAKSESGAKFSAATVPTRTSTPVIQTSLWPLKQTKSIPAISGCLLLWLPLARIF